MSQLYDLYGGALYGVILKIIGEETIAQDILQEVFVKIWMKIALYDEKKGRLFTWMLNLTRNTALDVVRSSKYKQAVSNRNLDQIENTRAGDRLKIDDIGVKEILNRLDAKQREVIELVYFKGYTHVEAAEQLNLPLGTVKTRVRSSLKLLRKHLE